MGTLSGLSGSNPLGFNSDKIVSQIVNNRYGPRIDRLNNRVSEAENTQSAYQDLNSSVDSLQTSVEALTNPDTFNQKAASSSNSDILGASVVDENKATEGTSEIFVEQLAQEAKTTSGSFINNQKMVATDQVHDDGSAATSVSNYEVVQGSGTLDVSEDYLDDLSYDVATSGDGDAEIDIEQGGTSASFDLDSYSNFQELMDDVNSTFSDLEMRYNNNRDRFEFIPTNNDVDGGTSFSLDDNSNENASIESGKGFFQQVGITTDGTVHDFNNTQEEYGVDDDGSGTVESGEQDGLNLLSVDSSKTFDNNLFSTQLNSNSGTIKVNNTEIDYDVNSDSQPSTINELVDEIDSSVDGVNAEYSSTSDKITLESEETGAGNISVEDVSGNLGEVLQLRTDGTADQVSGQDAKVSIDGTTVFESQNTFTRDGIQYSLNDIYKQTNNSGDPVEVTVNQDSESITSDVSDFVDKYNSVIETINENSGVDAPDSPDGEDNDSGAFVGSSTAQNIKRNLNRIVSRQFGEATQDNAIDNSSNVGIELKDPLSSSQSERGKISFDEGKFKEAVSDDPEAVKDLFAAEEGNPDRGGDQDGIAVQLNSFAESASGLNGFISNRIDGFDDRISRLNDRVERQQDRAKDEQERLQQKYLRLEQQVISLQEQQSSLGGL